MVRAVQLFVLRMLAAFQGFSYSLERLDLADDALQRSLLRGQALAIPIECRLEGKGEPFTHARIPKAPLMPSSMAGHVLGERDILKGENVSQPSEPVTEEAI